MLERVQDLWNVELCLEASFYPFDSLDSISRLSKSDDPDVLDPTLQGWGHTTKAPVKVVPHSKRGPIAGQIPEVPGRFLLLTTGQ